MRNSFLYTLVLVLLSGCLNMPTPTSQITGSYVSQSKYGSYFCPRLGLEMASITRRENALIAAQEERIHTSKIQGFWWGFGQGDGIEANELASVRGEKEAIQSTMDAKHCEGK